MISGPLVIGVPAGIPNVDDGIGAAPLACGTTLAGAPDTLNTLLKLLFTVASSLALDVMPLISCPAKSLFCFWLASFPRI